MINACFPPPLKISRRLFLAQACPVHHHQTIALWTWKKMNAHFKLLVPVYLHLQKRPRNTALFADGKITRSQCLLHKALCQFMQQVMWHSRKTSWYCQVTSWTWWQKFHKYYVQKKLFSVKGNVNTGSELYRMKKDNKDSDISCDETPPSNKSWAKKVLFI